MGYLTTLGRALLGRPTARMAEGYDAASTGRRLAGFDASTSHVNTLLASDGDSLRARCRKVVREDAWAEGAITDWVTEAVGEGIVPHPQHSDPTKRALLKDLWSQFADEADPTGASSVYGLQALAFRSALEGGDSFTRLRWRRPADNLVVPLQLQVLESEHVPFAKNETHPNKITAGVQFDKLGHRVIYHMLRNHPGDSTSSVNDSATVPVPAKSVMHEYIVQRPGQARGEPMLIRALLKLWFLAQYDDAELERKRLAAFMAGFIEPPVDGDGNMLPTTDTAGTESAGDNETFGKLEPGTFPVTPVGGKITIASAADVGNSYEPFWYSQLVKLGRAANLPYFMISGDLGKVNYSSGRLGLIKFRRHCRAIRANTSIHQWSNPTWRAFIDACVLGGHISAADLRANRREYMRVNWHAPKWEWIDPLKDVQADIAEVEAGLSSRTEKVAERGRDIDELDAERERDGSASGVSETSRTAVPRSDEKEEEEGKQDE